MGGRAAGASRLCPSAGGQAAAAKAAAQGTVRRGGVPSGAAQRAWRVRTFDAEQPHHGLSRCYQGTVQGQGRSEGIKSLLRPAQSKAKQSKAKQSKAKQSKAAAGQVKTKWHLKAASGSLQACVTDSQVRAYVTGFKGCHGGTIVKNSAKLSPQPCKAHSCLSMEWICCRPHTAGRHLCPARSGQQAHWLRPAPQLPLPHSAPIRET